MGGGVTVPVITPSEPVEECIIDTMLSIFERPFEFIADVACTLTVIVNDVVSFIIDTAATFFSWLFNSVTTIFEVGVNIIRIVAQNSAGTTEKIIHAVITDTPVTSVPQITAMIPGQQAISDVKGGSNTRTFGATVDQPATIIFLVDGQEKRRCCAVTNATWECDFSSYSVGMHSVEVTVVNSNGSDSFSWSWEISEPCVSSGEYIDFTFYFFNSNYDSDQNYWRDAWCHHNALARWGHASIDRDSVENSSLLSEFKWKRNLTTCNSLENCFYCDNLYQKHLYIATVGMNYLNGESGDHAIVAEFIGDFSQFNLQRRNFTNWKFFQYDNLNIKPGDGQMPYKINDVSNIIVIGEITKINCNLVEENNNLCYTPVYESVTVAKFEIDEENDTGIDIMN